MWGVIGICLVALVVVVLCHWYYTWQNPKCKGKLPPGSMGLPIIGESIQFFTPNPTHDIQPFVKERIARYGELFRTNLVGQKVIVSTDSDFNYQIFQQEGVSFAVSYTESFMNISGRDSFVEHHGMIHKYLKHLVLQIVSPEKLKETVLPELDKEIQIRIRSWASQGVVEVKEATSQLLFEYFAKKLISYEESTFCKKLKESYNAFLDGLISFPLNIPGTAYHACLQGRKNVLKVIEGIFQERKISSSKSRGDFLDYLIEESKKENAILSEKMVLDFVFVLLFAAYETTSSVTTLAVKFIFDHPKVLSELMKEHEKIIQNRNKTEDSQITWEEYRSMNFTHMVINETVRLANIVPGVFRKAIEDVEIKGYTIPKDWLVMIVPSTLHLSPDNYDNPFRFNPWRWEGKKLHLGSKTFMAFGGGIRLCVGADFAKLQVAVFLHYLILNYRWTVIKGGDINRIPGLLFPNGLHIKISKNNEEK